jgi:SNF2 family DNA or RNA helicase
MISLKPDRIRWEHEDVRLMAKILGIEHAVIPTKKRYGWAPPVMSILKLAKRKGALLSRSARIALEEAETHYREVQKKKCWMDAQLYGPEGPEDQHNDPRARHYFKHQRADLAFLYGEKLPGVLIAHEAGVGKTLLAIRYPEFVQAQRNMIIVPNAAKEQWASEIGRWSTAKLPIVIVEGTVKQQIEQIADTDRGWVIGHWESLVHARAGWLKRKWDATILDEVQHIQNRNAQRTLTVHKLKADWRMAMTAHPYANGTNELFPVLKFLYPNLYPGFWRWAGMHIIIDEGAFGGLDLRTPRRPRLLQWEIAPFTIRRLWKDVWKNLPPITRIHRTAHLTSKGRAEYSRLKKQFFVELASHGTERNILAIPSMLARVTRLRQYLIDPAILGAKEPSVKYPLVHEVIQELGERRPVIFTMWRQSAVRLQKYLEKKRLDVGAVVGGMSSKQINRIKKRFLRGEYDAVIIMIKVGGTSLNFGKYGSIIYLDMPWNQRDVEQTEGRVRRPEEGTGKLVAATSYHIVVKDSYEERMRQHRFDKHEDFEKVFTVAQAHELFDDED